MTLKEKFTERLYNQSHDDIECLRIRFENVDTVLNSQVKIAQDFAIGFSEWLLKKYDGIKSIEELLEIYKKERGL